MCGRMYWVHGLYASVRRNVAGEPFDEKRLYLAGGTSLYAHQVLAYLCRVRVLRRNAVCAHIWSLGIRGDVVGGTNCRKC